jgi:hypothetical protein
MNIAHTRIATVYVCGWGIVERSRYYEKKCNTEKRNLQRKTNTLSYLSLLQSVQNGSKAHSASHQMGVGGKWAKAWLYFYLVTQLRISTCASIV